MSAKVTYLIDIVEKDGKDCLIPRDSIIAQSHWNRDGWNGLVVLTLPNGMRFTVTAKDLKEAAARCTSL